MNHSELYAHCTLCPRSCGADRLHGERGFCSVDAHLYCARAALHAWEEPCISGKRGSGTVFFSGCNLRCVYCQNRKISRGAAGKVLDVKALASVFLSLQEKGAENINLVTPTHYLPHLLDAIPLARANGLTIPIVYNCGGYERPEMLALLEGLIDIYLPDFKYVDAALAASLSAAPDYVQVAKRALREMVRQVGAPRFDADGRMTRGVIVRHLVLPEHAEDSKQLLSDLFALYGNRIFFSVMNQYTPPSGASLPDFLKTPLSEEEYRAVLDHMDALGIVRAFTQEGGTVSESFIPSFDQEGLSSESELNDSAESVASSMRQTLRI